MLKRYIRNIVKNEIKGIKLKITLEQSQSKTYWEDHFKTQLKHTESLVKGRDKEIYRLKEIIENLEGKLISKSNLLSEQKEENEKLKIYLKKSNDYVKSLEQENKELSSKNFTTNDIHIFQLEVANSKTETIGNMVEKLVNENQDLKQENEKLKESIEKFDGKLILKDNLILEQKQENEKLQSEVDEYYNKFLSEGIKKEKLQRKLREIKKEIDSQGFDHEGFYNLQNMYHRIENILKES